MRKGIEEEKDYCHCANATRVKEGVSGWFTPSLPSSLRCACCVARLATKPPVRHRPPAARENIKSDAVDRQELKISAALVSNAPPVLLQSSSSPPPLFSPALISLSHDDDATHLFDIYLVIYLFIILPTVLLLLLLLFPVSVFISRLRSLTEWQRQRQRRWESEKERGGGGGRRRRHDRPSVRPFHPFGRVEDRPKRNRHPVDSFCCRCWSDPSHRTSTSFTAAAAAEEVVVFRCRRRGRRRRRTDRNWQQQQQQPEQPAPPPPGDSYLIILKLRV